MNATTGARDDGLSSMPARGLRSAGNWAFAIYALAFVLLPFGRASELPLAIGAIAGLVFAIARFDQVKVDPYARLIVGLGLCFVLPMAISAIDAADARTAWTESLVDLRYIPFALLAVIGARECWQSLRNLELVVAIVLAVWTLDALVQAATGWSLGGRLEVDRISGIFGDDNLKLGAVLAVFSPFLLRVAGRKLGWPGAVAAGLALGVAILLAGARAAWLVYALVVLAMIVRALPLRRAVLALAGIAAVTLAVGAGAYATSERFKARIDRTVAAASGTSAGVDHALAFRLPIWIVSVRMIDAHSVNGVGVRGFRDAYPAYADPSDRWVDAERREGAYHPHQLVLELAAEMGWFGLVGWMIGAMWLVRRYRVQPRDAREHAATPAVALGAMLFPLNTHPAFYSSFWSLVLWMLVAWCVAGLAAVAATRDTLADPSRERDPR